MKHHTHLPSLADHYSLLLGLVAPWTIENVALDVDKATLDLYVVPQDADTFPCPQCGVASRLHDHAPERRWRHLDTMQFVTEIVARLPRITCRKHGVKTVTIPWADPHARWTILFERFAIEVLQGTSNITRAMTLLKIGWEQAQAIREQAVARGLARRTNEDIPHVGLDEKSFLKGHHYASIATDIDKGRVLDVAEHRTREAATILLKKAIPEAQRGGVKAIAMDMWEPFMGAARAVFGEDTDIVHDKFHVSGYLGKAVDMVRKKEHRALKKEGDETLTNMKYLFLKNPDNWEAAEREQFAALRTDELKVGRAWSIKEAFRMFWEYSKEWSAKRFFNRWYFWATHARLQPIIDTAKTLKRHLDGLLAYITHHITNAVTEGLNSKIQAIKANARGFRNFEHYRIAILFSCGKLDMMPL
ncbi:MAG: ISL3 family transposase [Candidatus Taylorbacteria bacterium CG11_big_fil_rev_8_21_14_0_20_46_11]|uniref:ISL3 family transposase n=1 Tax=Candidatus Taylorbacteria bacterium CG11_big_fil_rev_8_21_14_0_20_46_11 TaxID=1975025 RepID=A0A2H0KBK3_9BACT|nr:MAG: ISL3 family transposase [Candidatus Taylorbacteria bacterium CG11_big_fil_rev_8_21_14_0_20_46_11]